MALKEHQLWDLFDRVWRDYTALAAKLCNDMSLQQVDGQEVPIRLAAIQRDPRIDKAGNAFMWLGKAYVERTKPELLMNMRRDNLLHQALDVTDDFLRELGHITDQPGAGTIQDVANKYRPMFGDIHVQEIKKEIELAWKLASQERQPSAKSAAAPKRRKDGKKKSWGDSATKIIAALSEHHQYDKEECGNLEPITFRALAELAKVAPSSVTYFFQQQIKLGPLDKPRHGYRRICRDGSLFQHLRVWRGENLRHS